MTASIDVQSIASSAQRPDMPVFPFLPISLPPFEWCSEPTPAQSKVLDLVRRDIRAMSAIQPIHRILANTSPSQAIENPTDKIIDELAPLSSTTFPWAVKTLVGGAGLIGAYLFAKSTIFPSPDNIFGGILIGIIALLSLPIISEEFTDRTLTKEFELIPLEPEHLPDLKTILADGCTAEQFGNFVKNDLLPRIPIGHFRSLANESGTCLHDIMFWARDDLHFQGTTRNMVHKVIENLGVGKDTSLRVKAALLAIERDTTLDDNALAEINAELTELARSRNS